ncbi:MAG: KpsF/GutQ family sugar-phosphate isomerase [Pseudomonadota bacterium]
MLTKVSDDNLIESLKRSAALNVDAVAALKSEVDGDLSRKLASAARLILGVSGRVIVSGMGKSGHIGVKIAATLASTGTPAQFVHPAEASHGDLGMVTSNDAIIALSWSGETAELANVVAYSARFNVPLIAITSRDDSALARAADVCLKLPTVVEACPHGLAPTTSSVVQLAVGDMLAIALLEARAFSPHEFKIFHPAGSLGSQLKLVRELMHSRSDVPVAEPDTPMSDALITMSEQRFGCIAITDGGDGLLGVITDGDLRRHMGDGLLSRTAGEIMTPAPKTIDADVLAAAALEQMNASKISVLLVTDSDRLAGILHIHDLLRAGVA